jgi:hypothetical protein
VERDAQKVSSSSLRGLDAFAFFVADIQTSWGPFVAAYLTSVGWLQFDIGLILTIGTMASFALQVPIVVFQLTAAMFQFMRIILMPPD